MKMVRELGLERCESVRFLSSRREKNSKHSSLVREDQDGVTSGVSVVLPSALPRSYVTTGQLLKASEAGTFV